MRARAAYGGLTMDGERRAQLVPDLNARIEDLTSALEILLAAIGDASPSNLLEAVARAERVLQL